MNIEVNTKALGNLFFFRAMLTPKIITLVYWLALIGSFVSGISFISQSYGRTALFGVGIMVFGPFLARIWCELFVVLFKIEEHLRLSRADNIELQNQSDNLEG